MIMYCCGTLGFSSVFSFTNVILPAYFLARSSIIGAIARHGAHHSAQKSTITLGCCLMTWSNSSSVVWIGASRGVSWDGRCAGPASSFPSSLVSIMAPASYLAERSDIKFREPFHSEPRERIGVRIRTGTTVEPVAELAGGQKGRE